MNGMGLIQLASPQLNALSDQVTALTNAVGQESSALDSLSLEHSQLKLQVATLTPDNVVESNEFTGVAILQLLKSVDGVGSGLDAEMVGGILGTDLQGAIDSMQAQISGFNAGILLGPEQLTGVTSNGEAALYQVPANAVVTGAVYNSSQYGLSVKYKRIL